MDARIYNVNLTEQFRCEGSTSYIEWLDHVLDVGGHRDNSWIINKEYDFRIASSPTELESLIGSKLKEGFSARLIAGFCWAWSDPAKDGSLVPDVKIGDWGKPWNRKRGRNATPPQNDPYTIWATKDEGIEQIGCIYSAQGFEFDYCGILFGNDIKWSDEKNCWIGLPQNCEDPVLKKAGSNFSKLIQHTYKVLLTRGIKGTCVYFLDEGTRKYFERMLHPNE